MRTISPEEALELLVKSKQFKGGGPFIQNRPIRPAHVDNLARDMLRGAWQANGESIKIDANGQLRDGQHRLTAVVKTNIPLFTAVVTGIAPSAYGTIDRGARRTGGDTLSSAGYKNCNNLAAAAQMLYKYLLGASIAGGGKGNRLENYEILEFLKTHPDLPEAVRYFSGKGRWELSRLFTASLGAMLTYLFRVHDHDTTEQFWLQVGTGECATRGNPTHSLRTILIRNAMNVENKMTTEAMMGAAIKAWNAFVEGRKLTRVKVLKNEKYPQIKHPNIQRNRKRLLKKGP